MKNETRKHEVKKFDFTNEIALNELQFNSKLISTCFFVILVMITLFNIRRIGIISKMFNSFSSFFQFLGISLFFVSLILLFLYYAFEIGFVIYMKCKNKEYKSLINRFDESIDFVLFIIKCICVIFFLLIFAFTPCTVSGDSMNDTFYEDDRLVCVNVAEYSVNDVVIFDASNYTGQDTFYIKRAIGVGKDIISYDFYSQTLYVNGEREEHQRVDSNEFLNLVKRANSLNTVIDDSSFSVPDGYLLVLGDNRENSRDSRYFGFVKKEDVYGKVIVRFYPFASFTIF